MREVDEKKGDDFFGKFVMGEIWGVGRRVEGAIRWVREGEFRRVFGGFSEVIVGFSRLFGGFLKASWRESE